MAFSPVVAAVERDLDGLSRGDVTGVAVDCPAV
jgi:hypothetical protein